MKRILLSLLALNAVSAADVVTVDPAGVTTIAGTAPGTAPVAGEVKIGGGQVQAQGAVTAGDVVINRAAAATGAQAVRGDDARMTNARPAAGGDAATVGGRTPGSANGIAVLDGNGKVSVDQLPVDALKGLPVPTYDVQGAGTSLAAGGLFYFSSLTISTLQSIALPTKIYCSGDCTIGAAITATVPLEIEVRGNLTINAGLTAPFISIRCLGTTTVNGPLSAHGSSSSAVWTFTRLNAMSRPDGILDADANLWRALLIESKGAINTSSLGTMLADDIFISSESTISFGAEVRSYWKYSNAGNMVWNDGIRAYPTFGYGGAGGTAGGWGKSMTAANASIWRGTNNPHFLHTYDLARGSVGGNVRTDNRGAPGGRISVYAGGDINAGSVRIYADSVNNGSSGQMVGGAGTVRAVAVGTINGGVWTANGGTGNGSQEHGGGGGAFTVASAYAGTVTVTATAVSQATAGTAIQATLPSAVIVGLATRGIFSVTPPSQPLRY